MVYVRRHIFPRFFTPVYAVISAADKGIELEEKGEIHLQNWILSV